MPTKKHSMKRWRLSLVGAASPYIFGTVVQGISQLAVLPILSRTIASDELGVVAASLVVVQGASVLLGLGLGSAVTRDYFDGVDGPSAASRLLYLALTAAATLGALLIFAGPLWAGLFRSVDFVIGGALFWAAVASIPLACVQLCQAYLRAQSRAGAFVATGLIASVGGQGLGLGALVLSAGTGRNYIFGLAMGHFIAASIAIAKCKPRRANSVRPNLRRALAFGLPTMPHLLALYLLVAADRVMIEGILGLDALASYLLAYAAGGIVMQLVSAANNAWAPIILRSPADGRWTLLADTAAVMTRVTSWLTCCLIFSAPLLTYVLAPPDYDRVLISQLLIVTSLSAIPYVGYLASVHVLFFYRRSFVVAAASCAAALVNILLNFIALREWGLYGAAVVTVLSYMVLFLVVRRRAAKMADVPWQRGSLSMAWGLVTVAAILGSTLPFNLGGFWVRGALVAVSGVCLALSTRQMPRPL
jgi:O-antigen/teichoic acid export membrane protein